MDLDPIVGESVDEIFAVLNDVAGINNENDMLDGVAIDIDDKKCDEFNDLLFELQVGLYPRCTKYSSLNFLVKLMHLKVLHKWSNKCMDAMLKLIKDAFLDGNKLPTSHYNVKKLLSKMGLSYETIYVCKYDCALLWKENVDLQSCSVCNTSH